MLDEKLAGIQQQIELQQTKIKFFQKYLNSLKLVQTYYETEKKLSSLKVKDQELIEMILYKQKIEDLNEGTFVNLRTLSGEMDLCENQEKAELLLKIMNEKNLHE